MEDPNAALPGFRFYPSEEDLLGHYLRGKNANPGRKGLIKELDLYSYDPSELPESACFPYGRGGGKRHWFCYSTRAVNESRGKRRARNGYWRRKGRMRMVTGPGGNDGLGTRTTFIFYLGNSAEKAVRTNWVLYEYASVTDAQASFVLCRVFFKSPSRSSISVNGLNSGAEESVTAVRHVGVQYDEPIIPDKEVLDQIVTEQAPFTIIGCPVFIELQAQGSSSLTNNCAVNINALTAENVMAIINDDFLELDDLED